ncbi:MAG: thiol reductant ABC exporter subunit CydC [Rhodospirillaceae bacterium]|nr:thiol reductant ABC exporter subunit CydC [Rhodospirillaceae bacterium]
MYFDPRLWAFTEGVRGRIAYAVAVGLLATCVGIARLALLGWLIAKVFNGAGLSEIALPALIVAAAMLVRGGLEYWRAMVAHETAARVQRHIRKLIYAKIIDLGPAHFGLQRTGDVIVSMVDGVEQLETYFGRYLPQLFVAALTPVIIFAFAVYLDWVVACVLTASALFTLIAPMAFHSIDHRNSLARSKSYKAFAADFLDSIQGLGTLKAFGQSTAKIEQLATRARDLFRTTMWVLATNAAARGITDTGIAVGAAAALGAGAWRVTHGETTLEVLVIVLMLGTEVFRPLRDLRALLHNGMVGLSAALGIYEILDAEPLVPDNDAPGDPRVLAPTIAFEDVVFRYPASPTAAHDGVSFAVDAGERIGVVGPSGSGKSTILKLLLKLYEPSTGSIKLGGVDLAELDFSTLRSHLAVVSQDTYLFHGSVGENLRFGKPDATQAELEQAARHANAHEFIAALPEGYGTVIGERGVKLSGGQRQRIAIARALLRDAPVLVLDEALSAVDAENEWIIQEALDRLMKDRTTLIFAHRLSSVIDADRILVLDDGRIADTGSHRELISRPGPYQRLMAAQAQEGASTGAPPVLVSREVDGDEDAELGFFDAAEDAEPTDAIIRAEGMTWSQAFRALLGYVKPWRGKLMLTLFFGITRVFAYIGIGVVGALAVAAVKSGQPYMNHIIWLCALAPVAGVFHWLESWIAHDMAFRMLAEMRIDLFRKLDKLAPAYLLRRRTGDLVGMATQDVETVEYFFAHTIAPTFVAILVPALVMVFLGFTGWPMALALLPFLGLVALSPFLVRNRLDTLGSKTREALGDLNAHAVDTVQGLAEIVAFQQSDRRGQEFDAKVGDYLEIRLPFFRDLTVQTALLETITGLGGLAVVATGASMVQAGNLDSGLLPMLTLLAMAAFLPVSEIAHIGRQLADTLGSARRLNAVENEVVPVTDGPGEVDGEHTAGVHLDDVSFTYPSRREPALDHVSLNIEGGQTIALVGPSGAGKTTLAHLLLRFWDPATGQISLDGTDLRNHRLDELRARIALVAQDTYLFNDTLRANIMLARPDAGEADLSDAIERAALRDFAASLPDGLETPVGERGMRLSGGQRQRVAIARAFLKDAPVLILDEATSHLDAVSEQMVRSALEDLMAERTTVVIAHRLSTVRDADLIVAMDHGRIIESGRHTELLARGGLYAHLVQRQISGAAVE